MKGAAQETRKGAAAPGRVHEPWFAGLQRSDTLSLGALSPMSTAEPCQVESFAGTTERSACIDWIAEEDHFLYSIPTRAANGQARPE